MSAALPSRNLGRTGLRVSALGFGAAPLGDLYGRLDDRTAIDAVTRALALGVTLIDAAPLYGHGLAEHRVGTAIRGCDRARITLSTKVGRWMDPRRGRGDGSGYVGGQPHAAVIDYSRDGTLRAVVTPTDTQCPFYNRDHVVVQLSVGGATYRVVVNVLSDGRNGTDTRVRAEDLHHALVGEPFAV